MARRKFDDRTTIFPADLMCMELMAGYICDQEEKGEYDMQLTESVVREAMNHLSVRGLQYFDDVLAKERDKRKAAGV